MNKQQLEEEEADLYAKISQIQLQIQQKSQLKLKVEENKHIHYEEFQKLKVKSTILRKELEGIKKGNNQLDIEEQDNEDNELDSQDSNKVSSQFDESAEMNNIEEHNDKVSENDIHLKIKKKDDFKILTSKQLIKEKDWDKITSEKMRNMIDEKIIVLRQDFDEQINEQNNVENDDIENQGGSQIIQKENDGTQVRTYINNVLIKVMVSEVMNISQKKVSHSKAEHLEQLFRVNKETSFNQMLDEACQFWDLDPQDFTLVLPNMHDVMKLTSDPNHIAHTVSKYFEINRSKRAVLHLIRPLKTRREIFQEEKIQVTIKGAKKNTRFEVKDKRTLEQKIEDMDNKNREIFFEKYPDLKDELIKDTSQFIKGQTKYKFDNPDMSFCQLLISLSMFSFSIYAFYFYRDFNNEYYNRQLILQKLDQNPYRYQNYSNITDEKDLYLFLTQTLSYQLFLTNTTNENLKSQYAFQEGIIPLGKLRFRSQRYFQYPNCMSAQSPINQAIVNLRPVGQIKCESMSLSSEDQASVMVGDGSLRWHYWWSGAQLSTQGTFPTDDYYFTGDGYIFDISMAISSEEFNGYINQLYNRKYIHPSTAVIYINFNSYEPSQDRFIATQMTIYFSPTGRLLAYPPKITAFALDQIQQNGSFSVILDFIQLFFCLCYASRIIYIKIPIYFKKEEDKKTGEMVDVEIEGYQKNCSILVDLCVILIFMLKFTLSQLTNYHDIEGILNDNYLGHKKEEYIELVHYSDYYLQQYQMYTIIIILNMYNLMSALRIFRIVHWIMLIIGRTFNVIFLFMMLLLPMQLGFSFLSTCFIGPYLSKYNSLSNGIKMQIITMMGQQDSMSLMRNNYYFTIMWTMTFIVFFAYFFVTASIVAFEDGFDETVNEKGYPADFEKASKWKVSQYILWSLAWLPDDKLLKAEEFVYKLEKQLFESNPEENENQDNDPAKNESKVQEQ